MLARTVVSVPTTGPTSAACWARALSDSRAKPNAVIADSMRQRDLPSAVSGQRASRTRGDAFGKGRHGPSSINQRDTDDTKSVADDILAILKACNVNARG